MSRWSSRQKKDQAGRLLHSSRRQLKPVECQWVVDEIIKRSESQMQSIQGRLVADSSTLGRLHNLWRRIKRNARCRLLRNSKRHIAALFTPRKPIWWLFQRNKTEKFMREKGIVFEFHSHLNYLRLENSFCAACHTVFCGFLASLSLGGPVQMGQRARSLGRKWKIDCQFSLLSRPTALFPRSLLAGTFFPTPYRRLLLIARAWLSIKEENMAMAGYSKQISSLSRIAHLEKIELDISNMTMAWLAWRDCELFFALLLIINWTSHAPGVWS